MPKPNNDNVITVTTRKTRTWSKDWRVGTFSRFDETKISWTGHRWTNNEAELKHPRHPGVNEWIRLASEIRSIVLSNFRVAVRLDWALIETLLEAGQQLEGTELFLQISQATRSLLRICITGREPRVGFRGGWDRLRREACGNRGKHDISICGHITVHCPPVRVLSVFSK